LLFADSLRNQPFTLKTPFIRSLSVIGIYRQQPREASLYARNPVEVDGIGDSGIPRLKSREPPGKRAV
jgi:hypothetical protein